MLPDEWPPQTWLKIHSRNFYHATYCCLHAGKDRKRKVNLVKMVNFTTQTVINRQTVFVEHYSGMFTFIFTQKFV